MTSRKKQLEDITFVFDFDSTLTQVEAFEELGEISLKGNPKRNQILHEIKHITDLGIDGEISFTESLKRRIALLGAEEKHLDILVNRLKKKISGSVKRNQRFFKDYGQQIIVISAGFKEFIDPILKPLGIPSERIYANTFKLDDQKKIVGFDDENELSKPDGKIYQLKKLNLQGNIYVIGDGYSDYQMREAGIAHKFFAYTENITRQKILSTADHITPSFDEFLYLNKIQGSISYPKNRISVLLENGLHPIAEQMFLEEGYQVKYFNKESLTSALSESTVLCLKESSLLNAVEVQTAKRLLCLGIAGSAGEEGLSDLSLRGTAVFHTPEAEAIGRAEYDLYKILKIAKSGEQGGKFLDEIKVGISGMGSEGKWLYQKLVGLGVEVMVWDSEKVYPNHVEGRLESFKSLLHSDVVVLCRHSNEKYPELKKSNFQSKTRFSLICSGGFKAIPYAIVVHLFQTQKCIQACMDAQLPEGWEKMRQLSINFPLDFSFQESISTTKTKFLAAKEMAQKLISYINTGNSNSSLNLPEMDLKTFPHAHRLLHIHRNVPGVLAEINSTFARHRLNISQQYLSTNNLVGYLVTDINKQYDSHVLEELKKVAATIRFRVLY
ncbi:MAG: HAD-IB family phosphatase [Bacteroidia bacterium]|nr:HAD-IB family phosphatase [Bacteroidia bacterium]